MGSGRPTAKDKKISSESVTFRLGKDVLNELRREAENRQVSLNTLANQMFKQFIDWHFSAAKAGWIPAQREMLKKLLSKYSDEEAKELGKYVAEFQMPDLILLLRRQYDFASFLDVMEALLRVSHFPYDHTENDGKHFFVIQHDLGKKWSLYLTQLFLTVCEELASRPEIMSTDNTVTMKVDAVRCGVARVEYGK